MAKQAVKKGAGIKTAKTIRAWKQANGMRPESESELQEVSNANKPMDWILMPKAYVEALKLPGIPMNTVTSVIGHSNVGKSTLINHALVGAQRQGQIPVIIDTENSFSFQYAQSMGFKCEPVYGDVEYEKVDNETGEVTYEVRNEIIYWDGDFIYYNNKLLCDRFGNYDYSAGKEVAKRRTTAVIEDVSACINELLDAQDNGELCQDLFFIWDSVGSVGSFKEYNAKGVGNAMWAAAALSAAFNTIVNDRIPRSRKISSKYNNTFLYVNKVWMDAMTNPVGPAIMQTKGGKSMKYATRLEILMGGQLTAGVKRLTATSKGVNYSYGIETKIKVLKNHLDAPHNVIYEGNLIATDIGFIAPSELDNFKKEHVGDLLKRLQEISDNTLTFSEQDIEFREEEEDAVQ